ncbi:uncharacterized protein MYCFIDRAFT_166344, partial [Pseudocercospora fijiensis CIRAD86]
MRCAAVFFSCCILTFETNFSFLAFSFRQQEWAWGFFFVFVYYLHHLFWGKFFALFVLVDEVRCCRDGKGKGKGVLLYLLRGRVFSLLTPCWTLVCMYHNHNHYQLVLLLLLLVLWRKCLG